MTRTADLTDGPIGKRLLTLTLPMILGVFSVMAFNLVDTYFVAQLGTDALAAMSFTFPVVMIIGSIAMGLGMGTAAVVSRAIGEGDQTQVQRLTTDSLVLALAVVVLFALVGLLTIDPVFRLLGASDRLLPLIRSYMTVWYIGVVFLIVPMVGNSAIRATGDTIFPSAIMVTAAVINVILDPLLIFGLLGLPRLELTGAALATLISRALILCLSLSVLHFRDRMLDWSVPRLATVWNSWKQLLHIGLPAAATNLLFPLSMAVITRLVARFGSSAVAAVGAGSRVGTFALVVIMALSSSLVPFIGQNFGAGNYDRVRRARRYSNSFAFGWGLFAWVLFLVAAPVIARLFSDEAGVVDNIVTYLWVVPIGYGLQGIRLLTSSAFNAVNRPLISASLNGIRTFGLYIPLAFVGAHLFHLKGLFSGIALANVLAGVIALLWIHRTRHTVWQQQESV